MAITSYNIYKYFIDKNLSNSEKSQQFCKFIILSWFSLHEYALIIYEFENMKSILIYEFI